MTLDLKAPEGVESSRSWSPRADVLIENFRTGTMECFGLGYDVLSAHQSAAWSTARSRRSGAPGPRKDGAGYEALMQAFSGIMSITGEPGRRRRCARGVSFLDLTTGIFSAYGIVNALLHRAQHRPRPARRRLAAGDRGDACSTITPRGTCSPAPCPRRSARRIRRCRPIATSAAATASGSSSPAPTTASGSGWSPALGLRAAGDGRALRDEHRAREAPRELEAALEEAIAEHDREPLLKLLEDAGVPATPVNTVDQVMNDPQTAARGMIERVRPSQARRDPGGRHAGEVLAHAARACARRRRSRASTPTRCWPSAATPAADDRRAPGEEGRPIARARLPRDTRCSALLVLVGLPPRDGRPAPALSLDRRRRHRALHGRPRRDPARFRDGRHTPSAPQARPVAAARPRTRRWRSRSRRARRSPSRPGSTASRSR